MAPIITQLPDSTIKPLWDRDVQYFIGRCHVVGVVEMAAVGMFQLE